MRTIAYFSNESRPFSEQDLEELRQHAQVFNSGVGITGMLLYTHGNFIQVFEGPDEEVGGLWNRIQADPRHKNIIKLDDRIIDDREFPHWDMGFRNLNHFAPTPGFRLDGFSNPSSREEFEKQKGRAHRLLMHFANG